jgi:hypothetical protein
MSPGGITLKIEVPCLTGDGSALVLEPLTIDDGRVFVRLRDKNGRIGRTGVNITAADLNRALTTIASAEGWDTPDTPESVEGADEPEPAADAAPARRRRTPLSPPVEGAED